jgi:hypothetical protein
MKARTLILTAGAALALGAPAAQAASTSNRLFQTRIHTILAERSQETVVKGRTHKSRNTATHLSARANIGEYPYPNPTDPSQVYTRVTVGSTTSFEPKPTGVGYTAAAAAAPSLN